VLLRRLFIASAMVVVVGCGSSPSPSASSATTSTTAAATSEAPLAGDIPDNQAFVAYAFTAGGYTVKVPEGWARTDAPSATTFTDKLNTVSLTFASAPTAPTEATVTATDVAQLQAATSGFTLGKVSTVQRTAGRAVLVTYQGDGAPDPVTGKSNRLDFEQYSFWRNGTTAIITLSSGVGSDNVDPWATITSSFVWT